MITPLLDAAGTFATVREAFGLDDDGDWRLPFYAYLVRAGGQTVVVDTGVVPPGGEDPFLPDRAGLLPSGLERAGVSPGDVSLVVLTHLHVDHVGWNMRDGKPFFPNARYVAARADYEWITGARPDRPYVRDNVIGTYLHGPVLAKSPRFADELLRRALARRGLGTNLEPLDDSLAEQAARVAVGRPR